MSTISHVSNGNLHVPGYWHSEHSTSIPCQDIISYALSNDHVDPQTKVFVDALDPSRFVTYAAAKATILALAAGLKKYGVRTGDCICLHSYNNIEYPLLWLGIIAAGAIVSGSNPAYTPQELAHHFRVTNTKYIIAHADCLPAVENVLEDCTIPRSRVFTTGTEDPSVTQRFASWKTLLEYDGSQCVTFDNLSTQATTPAVHATTSGTTGLPKAAVLTHRYIVSQATAQARLFEKRAKLGRITQLQCLPVFHAFACIISIVIPLRLGITTYFLPRFRLNDYVNAIHTNHVTDSAVVPPIITALLRLSTVEHSKLQSIRYMICAGAPMNPVVQKSFSQILHPSATVAQCWGATELGWITVFEQNVIDHSGSVGRLLPNTCLKIVDSNDNLIVDEGVRGEALIRSPSMMLHYRNDEKANEGTHDDEGFYRTGDRVYIRDGRVHVESRIKDIMKVNGWQVSPEEIQAVIMQLEESGVKDCVVIGWSRTNADGLQETLPRAYVVKTADSSLTAEDIKAHVSNRLLSYKRLTGGVLFVDTIPRSSTGKILRRLLETSTITHNGLSATDSKISRLTVMKMTETVKNMSVTVKNVEFDKLDRLYLLAIIMLPLCFMLGPLGIVVLSAALNRQGSKPSDSQK